MTLVIGGPLDGLVVEDTKPVLWYGWKLAYFRRVIRKENRSQEVYLHKTLLTNPPQLEPAIRRFVIPPGYQPTTGWDFEVIAHYWWLIGDMARYQYARFL